MRRWLRPSVRAAPVLATFNTSLGTPMSLAHAVHSLSRRRLLATSVALGAVAALPACAGAATTAPTTLAQEAAIWGFPLVLAGRYLKLSQDAGIGFNRFHLNQDLATPTLHVAGPNIDTIYGIAWLDLSTEPVVITVPDAADRYYSIHLIDAYANTFAYIGRRETGTAAGTFVVTPPGWEGTLPQGARQIEAPTTLLPAITRTLVRGSADLRVAQELQARYASGRLSAYPNGLQTGVVSQDALNVLPKLDLSEASASY